MANDNDYESRTADEHAAMIKLLRSLEEGDEVLYRAGGSKGTTDPTIPLEVTKSELRQWDQALRTLADSDSIHDADDYDLDDVVDHRVTDAWNPDSHSAGEQKRVCDLLVHYVSDDWEIHVEGPNGGEYAIRESNGKVYHRATSHDGLGGEMRELTLVRRDGSEDEAQGVYDDLFADAQTMWTEREIAFREPAEDIDPQADKEKMGGSGYNYLCEIDDEGRFLVTPTTGKGDLHIEEDRVETYGRKRKHELIIEDDYETLVEDEAKEAIKALDWDTAHGTFDGDAKVWKFDRDTLAYSVQKIVDPEETDGESWTITVPERFARAGNLEHYHVPGIDENGAPVEGVDVLEADEEAQEAAEVEDEEEPAVPHYIDDDARESALEDQREAPDFYQTDDGGIEMAFFEQKAEEYGMDVEEVIERMDEYDIYPIEAPKATA